VSLIGHLARSSKLVLLVGAELSLIAVIGLSFWFQDLRYSLPAPKPNGWKAPAVGSSLLAKVGSIPLPTGQPVVFNFYNCDCACSRFNLDHLRLLTKEYGSKMRFVLVVEGGTKSQEEDIFRGLNLDEQPYCDPDGQLARGLGVYATPQAVVVDGQRRLVYRGNYNSSRYCSDPGTQFVRIAIESVLAGRSLPPGVNTSGAAYGCAIPAVSGEGGWDR
jgi:hypothetical protein